MIFSIIIGLVLRLFRSKQTFPELNPTSTCPDSHANIAASGGCPIIGVRLKIIEETSFFIVHSAKKHPIIDVSSNQRIALM